MASRGKVKLLQNARRRARSKGLLFDLQPEDVVLISHCPILKIPLSFSTKIRTNNSYSLDRIDNNKGYTKDNILVCSWRSNFLKGDATVDELEKIVRYYKRLNKKTEQNEKTNSRRTSRPLLSDMEKADVQSVQNVSSLDLSTWRESSNRRASRYVAMLVSDLAYVANRSQQECSGNSGGSRKCTQRIREKTRRVGRYNCSDRANPSPY